LPTKSVDAFKRKYSPRPAKFSIPVNFSLIVPEKLKRRDLITPGIPNFEK